MNGGEWHSVNRYDEGLKRDENICCVGYNPLTGEGLADAHLISVAPELAEVVQAFIAETVDYATINNLGDPEKQHNVKWGLAVLAKAGIRL